MLALLLVLSLQTSDVRPGRTTEPLASSASPSTEALALELARPGPTVIPELFSRLAADADDASEEHTRVEDALVLALASFGREALRPTLRARLEAKIDASTRFAALRVLARVATGDDLVLVRRAMDAAGPGLEGSLQETCAGLLGRDPRALEPVRRWMLEAPPEVGAALARALADSGCPGALEALSTTLGYRAELDPELLSALARLIARAPMPLDDEVLGALEDVLEEALERGDARVLREAVLALGHARHAAVVPRLIPLLEHGSRGVTCAADWALGCITGLHFHSDPRRWSAWLTSESDWYARHAERVREDLGRGDPVLAIRALGELSSHPWHAHEFALAALPALEDADPRVRRLACLTLARLGSTAAEPGLRQALEDEDASVARAARLALESLGVLPPALPLSRSAVAIPTAPSRNPGKGPRSRLERS